jgi:hypothetical protein
MAEQGRRLMEELGLDDREIAWRKAFLEFGEEDAKRLASAHEIARSYARPVIEDFYRHLLSFEETRAFFADPRVLAYVKKRQIEYFQQLTGGEYGIEASVLGTVAIALGTVLVMAFVRQRERVAEPEIEEPTALGL